MIRLLVAAVLAALLVGAPPATAAERPNPADLEAELVCPTCKSTLSISPTRPSLGG